MKSRYTNFFLVLVGVILVGGLIVLFVNQNRDTNQVPVFSSPSVPGSSPNMTVVPTTSPSPVNENQVTISLVSLENEVGSEQTIGCGDSLVSVQREVQVDNDNEVEAALLELLNTETRVQGDLGMELYNALAASDLQVARVVRADDSVNVYLEGDLSLGGACDTPRVEEQLINTVENNVQTEEVQIFINDQSLDEVVSLRG